MRVGKSTHFWYIFGGEGQGLEGIRRGFRYWMKNCNDQQFVQIQTWFEHKNFGAIRIIEKQTESHFLILLGQPLSTGRRRNYLSESDFFVLFVVILLRFRLVLKNDGAENFVDDVSANYQNDCYINECERSNRKQQNAKLISNMKCHNPNGK